MKKTKKGFTLVELVIVVAVMAVLVAVAIPTVGAITNTAKENVAKTNAQTIESMIKLEQANTEDNINSAQEVADAIAKAKLGITEGYFMYNYKTGECNYEEDATYTLTTGDCFINFSDTKVTVTDSAGSADANLAVS